MKSMDVALEVFLESVLSTLWPLFHRVTLYASQHFLGDETAELIVPACLGVLSATVVLWCLGYGFSILYLSAAAEEKKVSYEIVQQKLGIFFLSICFFSWMSVGFAIGFSAGFMRVSLVKSALYAALGSAAFFAYRLFA